MLGKTGATGLEPATPGFGDRCATNCATPLGCPRIVSASFGHHPGVSTIEEDRPDDDDLLEEQEQKGYGEDEGEREQALEADDE